MAKVSWRGLTLKPGLIWKTHHRLPLLCCSLTGR